MPAIRNYIVEVVTRIEVIGAVTASAAIGAANGVTNVQAGMQPGVGEARVIQVTAREDGA